MNEPDVFLEPLVGWRTWRAERHLLYSVNSDTPWPALRRMEGECTFGSQAPGGFVMHEVPSRSCHCGIYAFKTRAQAEDLARRVLGRVSMWGRVVETERGYRAKYADPYEVFVLGGTDSLTRSIREFYAVDVSREDIPTAWRLQQAA